MSDQNSVLKQRRDEIVRCKDVIGWSWITVGQRLGLTSAAAFGLKNCKRPISDQDLSWLQTVAAAVDALPRPDPIEEVPMRVSGGVAMERGDRDAPNPASEFPGFDPIPTEFAETVLAQMYVGLGNAGLTAEQREGASWAISELAAQLGVTAGVAEQIKRRGRVRAEQTQAPTQAEQAAVSMGRPPDPAASWSPPGAAAWDNLAAAEGPAIGRRVPM